MIYVNDIKARQWQVPESCNLFPSQTQYRLIYQWTSSKGFAHHKKMVQFLLWLIALQGMLTFALFIFPTLLLVLLEPLWRIL